jgi:hypothetical protein
MLRFVPSPLRPFADLRGTLLLTFLSEMLKVVNRLAAATNDGLFDEYFD